MERVGRFQITRELGRGAMGVVYQAIDPTIGRSVAIKTVRLREMDDAESRGRLRERLFREARAAGALSHPNLVTIYDMDEEEGVAYIAMQYVNGPTVEALLESPRPISPDQIFRIVRQTAAGLDFAHSKGIVHRDIKPANLMIDEDGTLKIADFGIAKASAAGNLTASGTILGTPNYMSPEQVQGGGVTGRSDQFSLGVVAYEILTGERPFEGENLPTVVYRIVAEPAAEPAQINPALGEEIGRVLQKALQKNPKRRFLSCTEFANALIAACEETPGWHTLARPGERPAAASVDASPGAASVAIAKKPRRKTTAAQTVLPLVAPAPGPLAPVLPAKREPSIVLPAFGAFAVVLGILALVAWQTGATADPAPRQKPARAQVEAAPPEDVETPPTGAAAPAPTRTATPSETQGTGLIADSANRLEPKVTEQKPTPKPVIFLKPAKRSPFGTASPLPAVVLAPVTPPERPLRDVSVLTEPEGATATLDGHTESACRTPCLLLSEPGLHLLSLTLRDHQPERRQIRIGEEAEDVPLIIMRPLGGTLMVSTVPAGANVFLNDRMLTDLTPARITLQPGRYNLAVERDGVRKSQQVVIKNGAVNILHIPLPD